MAKATTITRRAWQCPSCGRTFRIPQAAPPPLSCPDCESAAATTSSKRGKGGKPVVETTFFESEPEYQRAVRNTSSDAKPSQSAAVLESGSIETAEILEHLRNISHTMTTVRRIMWLFIGIMLMTIMFGLGSAFMMMQTLSGFLPIVQQVVQPVGNPAIQSFRHFIYPAGRFSDI